MNNKAKILFIGNCQSDSICHMTSFPEEYDINKISILNRQDQILERNLIQDSDIIITQRIRDQYDHLSTKYILKNKRKNTKIIIYPSCYMKLYYFDAMYFMQDNKIYPLPSSYHYKYILNSFFRHLSPQDCLEKYIDNKDLLNHQQLQEILDTDIVNLQTRNKTTKVHAVGCPDTYIIDIIDLIKHNYKNQLLFYSFNHPSDFILKYIIDTISDILDLPITTKYSEILSADKCILYSCLSNVLEFDINSHPCTIQHKAISKIDLIDKYYQQYLELLMKNQLKNTKIR